MATSPEMATCAWIESLDARIRPETCPHDFSISRSFFTGLFHSISTCSKEVHFSQTKQYRAPQNHGRLMARRLRVWFCNRLRLYTKYTHTYVRACKHTDRQKYTHTNIHAYTNTYIYIHIHTNTYTYIHIHIHTCTYTNIHIHIFTNINMHMHTFQYKYKQIQINISIYIQIQTQPYINIHIDIQRHTNTYIYN